jgi:hypothetical protein
MVWDSEGTVWLLPAYAFTDDQGGSYSVIAIDDAFIELPTPEPAPMPEPMPVETAVAPAPDATTTPVTVDQASADKLVGLSEEAAIEQAKLNDWTPRVVSRDGESLPGTADYRLDRVNLTIVAGKVTAVTLG